MATAKDILKDLRFEYGISVECIMDPDKNARVLLELVAVQYMVSDGTISAEIDAITRDSRRARAVIALMHHALHERWNTSVVDGQGVERHPFRQLAWALNLDASQPWAGGEPVRLSGDQRLTGRRATYSELHGGFRSGQGAHEETAFEVILEALNELRVPPIGLDGGPFRVASDSEPSDPRQLVSRLQTGLGGLSATSDDVLAPASRAPIEGEAHRDVQAAGADCLGTPIASGAFSRRSPSPLGGPAPSSQVSAETPDGTVTINRRILGLGLAAGAFLLLAIGALIGSTLSDDANGADPAQEVIAGGDPGLAESTPVVPTTEPLELEPLPTEPVATPTMQAVPSSVPTVIPTPVPTAVPTATVIPVPTATPVPSSTPTPTQPMPTPTPVSLASLAVVSGDWEGDRTLRPDGWNGAFSGFGPYRQANGTDAVALHMKSCSTLSEYEAAFNLDRRYEAFTADVFVESFSSSEVEFQLLFSIDNEASPRAALNVDLFSGSQLVQIDTTGALRLTIEAIRVRCDNKDDFRVVFGPGQVNATS